MNSLLLTSSIIFSFASLCVGDSNSDRFTSALFGHVESKQESVENGAQINDPFLQNWRLFVGLQKTFPEFETLTSHLYKGDFVSSIKHWPTVQKKLPPSLRSGGRLLYLYVLYRLDLPQTFLNEWLELVTLGEKTDPRLLLSLEETIQGSFEINLEKYALLGVSEKREEFPNATQGPLYLSLHAWNSLRNGEGRDELLQLMPKGHPFKLSLARSVVLAHARKGDLPLAGRVLKEHVLSELIIRRSPSEAALYSLTLARLLYQAGSFDGAEHFYEKVPNGSSEFLTARQELLWTWLRMGNTQKLRGGLESFHASLLSEKSSDIYVIKAISNLKNCFLDQVDDDLNLFINSVRENSKKIDEALLSVKTPRPDDSDYFSELSERRVFSLKRELETLHKIESQTGIEIRDYSNEHLVKKKLEIALNRANDLVQNEYHRIWKNKKALLLQSIEKMKFVKIEYLAQLKSNSMTDLQNRNYDFHIEDRETQSYPFEGILWPDEVFKLKSVVYNRCKDENRGSTP